MAKALFIDATHWPLINALKQAFPAPDYDQWTVNTEVEIPAKPLAERAYDTAIIVPRQFVEKPFLKSGVEDWGGVLAEDFERPVFAAQAVARHMIAHDVRGRIIFLSSVAALKSYENLSMVGSALCALHSVAKMAAVDLAPYGITVNVIALGWFADLWQNGSISDDTLQANIPTGQYGELDKIAELCRFLASDSASYLTGAVIQLDGGYSLTKAGAGTPRQ